MPEEGQRTGFRSRPTSSTYRQCRVCMADYLFVEPGKDPPALLGPMRDWPVSEEDSQLCPDCQSVWADVPMDGDDQ